MVNTSGMKMFAEFLGTFILAASIELITIYEMGNQTNSLFAILGGFFVAITLTREISGGHINPAVTMTVYLAEDNPKDKAEKANSLWMYIVAQGSGAISAALLGSLIYNENIFNLAPSPNVSPAEVLMLEIVGSTLFYIVILTQGDKDARLCNDKTISTITITAGLAAGIAMAGNISGACLNPALGFGFNFCRLLTTGKMEACKYVWAYILGPLVGSYFASYFYLNVFRKFFILKAGDDKVEPLLDLQEFE